MKKEATLEHDQTTVKPQEIKAVIFDMDGLLFDTERLILQVARQSAWELGSPVPEELFVECIGLSDDDTKKVIQKKIDPNFPYGKFVQDWQKKYKDHIRQNGVPLKRGVYQILARCQEKSLKIGLASSSSKIIVNFLLKNAAIKHFFPVIVTGDMVKNSKPDPEIFLKTAEKMHVQPEEVVVLEDSENGIRAAEQAKMLPIMIPDLKAPSPLVKKLAYQVVSSLEEAGILIDELVDKIELKVDKFHKPTFEKIPQWKRQRILETAIHEFAKKGFNAANINVIADKAGISIGSMYSYFESKDHLFLTIINHGYTVLETALSEATSDDDDVLTKFEKILRATQIYSKQYRELTQIYLDISTEGLSHLSGQLSRKMESITVDLYCKLIEEGKRNGAINPELNTKTLAFCFDNLALILQYSYTSAYFKERMKLFFGSNEPPHEETLIKEIMRFVKKGMLPQKNPCP